MGGRPVRDDELFIVKQGRRHRAVGRNCEHCGGHFLAMVAIIRGVPQRFCSLTCARSVKLADRFWSKVERGSGCWVWQGSVDLCGYGMLGASRHQRAMRAHRVSWEMHNGTTVPDGLQVLHHCDNPPCVRPDHLYVGTQADNARDRKARGRNRKQDGESGPNAKLTRQDVAAIREAVSAGHTQTEVAKQFEISQQQVSRIVNMKVWIE